MIAEPQPFNGTQNTSKYPVERCPLFVPGPGKPFCSFTVDVEDWFQSSWDFDAPISERVLRNSDRMLSILQEAGVKATMFVQGKVAETFPQLVQTFIKEGHEIQSHGYSHRPLFEMDRKALRQELDRAKKSIEDAAGFEVSAFRAQDFSILQENLWALEEIADAGFRIDSSIFPRRMKRYGIGGWEPLPHRITLRNGRTLLEVPVVTWKVGPWRMPVAGGGYFRLLPAWFLEHALCDVLASHQPVVIYCHPYEFWPGEMSEYRSVVPWSRRVHQGLGRKSFVRRIRYLLKALPFGRFDTMLKAWRIH